MAEADHREIEELKARLAALEQRRAAADALQGGSAPANPYSHLSSYHDPNPVVAPRAAGPSGSAPFKNFLSARDASTATGWIVGGLTIIGGLGGLFGSAGYPPQVVGGAFLLLAGAFVLPPITALARKVAPFLRPTWAPPLVFVLLIVALGVTAPAVEPRGAERQSWINRAIAAADADIKAHDALGAHNDLAPFTGDATTNPAVKAALARVAAEQLAESNATRGSPGSEPASSATSGSGGSPDGENAEHKANLEAIPVDMARVYDSLRDQSGVKWGTMTGTRNGTTLCGSVNAHNAFGGYTGQRRFIFDQAVGDPGLPPGRDAYLHWEERPGFAREWNRLCLGDANSVTLDGQSQAGLVEAIAPQEQDSGQ